MKKNCNDIISIKFNYIVKAGKFTHLVDAKSKAKYNYITIQSIQHIWSVCVFSVKLTSFS